MVEGERLEVLVFSLSDIALCGSEVYAVIYRWSCHWNFSVKKQTKYLLFQSNISGVFVG